MSDDSAEKAYATAAAELKAETAETKPEAKGKPAPTPKEEPETGVSKAALAKANASATSAAPEKKASVKKEAVKKAAPKPAAKAKPKAAPKPKPAKVAAKAKPAPAKKPAKAKPGAKATATPAAKPVASTPPKAPAKQPQPAKPASQATKINSKESVMATAPKIEDMSAGFSNVMSEMQSRAKAAYEKSTEMAGESTEFAKGNVEAMVEAGKIWMTGLQDMARSNAEDAKTAFEAATSDMKEMAAAKSPTDLFQLQGELMRRNADKAMEMGSRNAELTMKLVNDAFAPIGSRVSVAQEKFSKVA